MTYFRRSLITSSAVTLLALLVPFNALAQDDAFRRAVHSDQGVDRAYSAGYASKYALNEAVRQLAYRSQGFQWRLERELNLGYLDNSSQEKRANQLTVRFRKAAETLHSLYAVGRTVDNSTMEAGKLLRLGHELDDFLWQARVSRATLQAWEAIDCELARLATVYDYDFDTDSGADPGAQDAPLSAPLEYHSAALSYSRVWRWPF